MATVTDQHHPECAVSKGAATYSQTCTCADLWRETALELRDACEKALRVINTHIDVRQPVVVPGISRILRAAIARTDGQRA